jgi:hypothetical protein
LDQFLTNGVTDQAMLKSVFGSIFTQYVFHSPGEWPKDWTHYGYRVGSSYLGSAGRSGAEFIMGTILHDDPRHIKCSDDPRLFASEHPSPSMLNSDKPFACTNAQRFFHALLDTVTVRHSPARPRISDPDFYAGNNPTSRWSYHRLPALDRLVGVYAAAYVVYPWQPGHSNTFGAISQRAGLSFGGTFFGSFFTEYGGVLLHTRKKSVDMNGGTAAVR